MSEFTEAVLAAAKALDAAEKDHQLAKQRLDTVRCHAGQSGQSGYSVVVNGITVAVSVWDSRSYQGTLIRGREMIHLGALKALGAQLQLAADRAQEAQARLASLVNCRSKQGAAQ